MINENMKTYLGNKKRWKEKKNVLKENNSKNQKTNKKKTIKKISLSPKQGFLLYSLHQIICHLEFYEALISPKQNKMAACLNTYR